MPAALASDAPDPATARTERHMAHLAELAEIGMDLAREVRRQALAAEDGPSAAECALTFSRVARAVRQTVALEVRLAAGEPLDAGGRAQLTVSDRWRSARRRKQVRLIVGEVIEAEADGDFEADRLLADLTERLDDGDEEADFADRPIGELVARICRDIGITPDWSLFEDEDWAIAEARERPPGSPFASDPPHQARRETAASDPPWSAHDPPDGASH